MGQGPILEIYSHPPSLGWWQPHLDSFPAIIFLQLFIGSQRKWTRVCYANQTWQYTCHTGGTLSRHGRHACRDMCSYNQHNRFISIESAGRKNNVANTLHHNTSHKNKCSENELNSWSINIYLKYTLKKRLNKLGDAENVKWFGFFFLKIREIQNGPLRINQDRVVIFDSHN